VVYLIMFVRSSSERLSNGNHAAEMLDELGFFGGCEIFVERAHDQMGSRGVDRRTQQPEEAWWRDQYETLEAVLGPPMLKPVRELSREVRDRPLVRPLAAAHRSAARVSAVLSEGPARPIAGDFAISLSTGRVLDLLDQLEPFTGTVVLEQSSTCFVGD